MANELFIATNVAPGMLIRLSRVHRGWRQKDLAEKAGVTQAEVSALERGLYVIPSVRRRVLVALDLTDEDAKHA
jgi:transcriptional regulator with XRE-family HTH domain